VSAAADPRRDSAWFGRIADGRNSIVSGCKPACRESAERRNRPAKLAKRQRLQSSQTRKACEPNPTANADWMARAACAACAAAAKDPERGADSGP